MSGDRVQAYKRELIEKARPRLGEGEEVRVLALAQTKTSPWTQAFVTGVGSAMLVGSFFSNSYPAWVGIAGAAIMLAGIALGSSIPRRLLLRTDELLYVFALPTITKKDLEAPLAVHRVDELPAATKPARLAGERLWPNFGSPGERTAIARAIAPVDPRRRVHSAGAVSSLRTSSSRSRR